MTTATPHIMRTNPQVLRYRILALYGAIIASNEAPPRRRYRRFAKMLRVLAHATGQSTGEVFADLKSEDYYGNNND